MQNALIVVIANLRPRKLAGQPSHGMVLCAETSVNEEECELLRPPAGSEVGDLITFEGQQRDPPALLHKEEKKNAWFKLKSEMKVDANRVATCQGCAMATPKGQVTSSTITNGIFC